MDRNVGVRMRERRNMLGLTQQELANLIGITNQQVLKYEKGIDRITAGRLHQITQALGVKVGYFFEGLEREGDVRPTPPQHRFLELARDFVALPSRRHQEALCTLARVLADAD
jgi:transcriptional regulator with XRE-family HTH domain